MYPNLYFIFREWFGVRLSWLQIVNTFGFFVAISFIAAAIVLTSELKRKAKEGLLQYEEQKIIVGKPATISELIINFLIGFLMGYKIIGAIIAASGQSTFDVQEFFLSAQGNWIAGIALGGLFAWMKWNEKNKQKQAHPEERTVRIWPHDRVGDIVIFAAIFGFAGAKIFDNLENWNAFIQNPIANLLSPRGLTFYGGLICAALAIWWYAKKHKIHFWHLNDAAAPALMLSYSTGRIGCQVAGDGDWGIENLNPKPFSWLPDWAWSYTYPHNVNKEGVLISNCDWGEYCYQLPNPVYPTPLYEIIMAFILFLIIWVVRKKFKTPGTLFGFYLFVNGIERFLIEKIRVNTTYDIFGFHPTQAELISSAFIIIGAFLMIYLPKKARSRTALRAS